MQKDLNHYTNCKQVAIATFMAIAKPRPIMLNFLSIIC